MKRGIDIRAVYALRNDGFGYEDICVRLGYLPLSSRYAQFVREIVLSKPGRKAA